MNITNFDVYKNLLKEKSGLIITPDKSYLLDSRLNPIAKKWNFPSLEAMTEALKGVPDNALVNDIIEAMTTNETSFFRDNTPFELFKDTVLPELLKKRAAQKRIKIWCAASSSGQEPYSLAITIKELGPLLSGWDISILATDISHEILNQAREGLYTQFEVQRGLPIQMLMKYFVQEEEKWRLNNEIRSMIKFDYFNLLESMNSLPTFDIIFCRNVLIYFDEATKKSILEKMAGQIQKDGFLFLGGAETVLGITDAFKVVTGKRGLYSHKDSTFSEDGPKGSAQALAQ